MNQSEMPPGKKAILLIAHGSRRQEANEDLIRLRDMIRASRPNQIIEHSFLELAQPTISEGATCCVEQNASKVLMFPYFLSAGVHVVEDLDQFKIEFERKWPETEFVICPPLGLHRLMVDIVYDRIGEAEATSRNEK